jgi:hypothetical protein
VPSVSDHTWIVLSYDPEYTLPSSPAVRDVTSTRCCPTPDEVVAWRGDDVGVALGAAVGDDVGDDVGVAVGVEEGEAVGDDVGVAVGAAEGDAVGAPVGVAVGAAVGFALGDDVGVALGAAVGDDVGDDVGVAGWVVRRRVSTSTTCVW